MKKIITEELLKKYKAYLYEQEKSVATIQKYICDLKKLMDYAGGKELDNIIRRLVNI